MLQPAKQLTASFHAELYKLVPENHLLRKIHATVDFGFIHELVKHSYCKYYGRPANEPELLFRLLFLQILYNLSDERIIQEAQVNPAYKWFIGINPEDSLPDASQLSASLSRLSGTSGYSHIRGFSQASTQMRASAGRSVPNRFLGTKNILQ